MANEVENQAQVSAAVPTPSWTNNVRAGPTPPPLRSTAAPSAEQGG
ncbi:MAG: hypothetical protein ACIAXF_02260 [Phycisphaerales bacterium JB063]